MRHISVGMKIAAGSLLLILLLAGPLILFAQQPAARSPMVPPEVMKWAFLAAAVSVAVSTMAGAVAVGMVGAAAMGVIGERPEVAPRALIFVGLAEGIAIYGLIVSVMILGKV